MFAAGNLISLHFLFDEMEECIMKEEYKLAVWYAVRKISEDYRIEHQYTQEEMAEQLDISEKAYSNMKRGVHGFSAVTLLMLLIHLEDEQMLRCVEEMRILRKNLWEQS